MKRIAIIGGGPSGSALATFLALRGIEATIFDDGKRPDLIVGESLIPALIPLLRKLGVEERVAEISVYKPGVTFILHHDSPIHFNFSAVRRCKLPTYAYNTPRPEFDRVIAHRALEVGARRVSVRARLEVDGDRLFLANESLAAAPWLDGKQPDLLVDATGRTRLFAKTLGIPARAGSRKDVAHFAHFEDCEQEGPAGQVLIGRMEAGWCWRIPLRNRLSIGIVVNRDDAAKLGSTPEERLLTAMRTDPRLATVTKNARRVSEIATYTNYQLISERGHGPNWTMSGDAFGFVDPMLSPGMFMALHSAEWLADHLDDLEGYAKHISEMLEAWMEFIAYYYDGRMFAAYHTGYDIIARYNVAPLRWLNRFLEGHIACMASGGTTAGKYARELVKFLTTHGVWKSNPAEFAIR
ncbi:MAG TPA: NAD(P)/FAD-dependent oxidoreductase [Chthoniobacterales bacterium]